MFNTENDMIPLFITATLLTVIFIFFLIASLLRLKNRQIKKERELLHALIGERERTMYTISTEIHDNISQMLHLARMTLAMINKHAVPEQKKYITESGNILDSAIGDLSNISHSLNSEYLKSRGLYESLREEVNWLNTIKKITCSLQIQGVPVSFRPDTELMIIRIAQEAIHNTLKHAHADNLYIRLDYGADTFQISIRDNGSGFLVLPQAPVSGVGMQSMLQRSKMINGHLDIQSMTGTGTKIILTLPLQGHQ